MDELGRSASSSAVRLAGGGSTHPAWRQLLADVLRRPLDAVEVTGASGRERPCLAVAPQASSTRRPCSGDWRHPRGERAIDGLDRSEAITVRYELWLKHVTASRQMTSET